MEPPRLHRVERKPVRKECLPAVIFPRSNQLLGIAPLFRRRARHLDIESPVLIVAHHGQALELALNTNQPSQQTAANDNLPMLPFAQHIQVRGIKPDRLRQIGKELSIYNLSFISVCPLNFNKLGRIKSVHQVFILKNISHLGTDDYTCPANHNVDTGIRMPVDPGIDPAVGNQVSVFANKGHVVKLLVLVLQRLPKRSANNVFPYK